MNMLDYWVMSNGMNEEAMKVYGEMFAPSMPDMESHLDDICPCCNGTGKRSNGENIEIDMDMTGIDEVLNKS